MRENPHLIKTRWTKPLDKCSGVLALAAQNSPTPQFASFDQAATPFRNSTWNREVRRAIYEVAQNWNDQMSHTLVEDKDALQLLTASTLAGGKPTDVSAVGWAASDDGEQGLFAASAVGFIEGCGHQLLDDKWKGKFAVLFFEFAHVLHPSTFKMGVQAKTTDDGGGHGEGFKLVSRWCAGAGLTLVFLFFTGPFVIEMSSTAKEDMDRAGRPQHISDLLLAGFEIRVLPRNVDGDPTRPLLPPYRGATMDDLRAFELHCDPAPQMISFIAVDQAGQKMPSLRTALPSTALGFEQCWVAQMCNLTRLWTDALDPHVPVLTCDMPSEDGVVTLTVADATNYRIRDELAVDPRFNQSFHEPRMVAHGIAYAMPTGSCRNTFLFSTTGNGKPGTNLATFLDSNRNPDPDLIAHLVRVVLQAELAGSDAKKITHWRTAFAAVFGTASWAFEPTDRILISALDKPLIYRLWDIDQNTIFYLPNPRTEFLRCIWPAELPPLRKIDGPAAYSFEPKDAAFLQALFLPYAATRMNPPTAPTRDGEAFVVSAAPGFLRDFFAFAVNCSHLVVRFVDVSLEPQWKCDGNGFCLLSPSSASPRVLCVPVDLPAANEWSDEDCGLDASFLTQALISLDAHVNREMCVRLSVIVNLKMATGDRLLSVCAAAIAEVTKANERRERLLQERADPRRSTERDGVRDHLLRLPSVSAVERVSRVDATQAVSTPTTVHESTPSRPALESHEDKFMGWLVVLDEAGQPTEQECRTIAEWAVPEVAWCVERLLRLFDDRLPFSFQFAYAHEWAVYGTACLTDKLILLNMARIKTRHALRHTIVHELGHLGFVSSGLAEASWVHEPVAAHNATHNTHCLDIATWLGSDLWNVAVAAHAKDMRSLGATAP